MAFKVVVADKQFLTNYAIKNLLSGFPEFQLVGSASNSLELFSILKNERVDMIIVDPVLFNERNHSSLKAIAYNHPKIVLLVITNSVSYYEIKEFTKLKIKTIVYKSIDYDEFYQACLDTLEGKVHYSEEVLSMLIQITQNHLNSEKHLLTQTEIDIIKKIATGLTTKEIADEKNISNHTVMTHRKNIFKKVGINNSSELIMYAIRTGVIDSIDYII